MNLKHIKHIRYKGKDAWDYKLWGYVVAYIPNYGGVYSIYVEDKKGQRTAVLDLYYGDGTVIKPAVANYYGMAQLQNSVEFTEYKKKGA